MRQERVPWLTVVPWSQVVGLDGYAWTVLPHWPPYQKRIVRRGREVQLFSPGPLDMATVLVPDEADALATLAATFGRPELIAWRPTESVWWTCPAQTLATVLAHLRDWHGTLERGSPTARITHHSPEAALAYHWQLHQQQLVHPDPLAGQPHYHGG